MGADRRFPIKLLVVMFTGVILVFGVEIYYEVAHSQYPAGHPLAGQPVYFWKIPVDSNMVRAVASPFARAYNQLLALVLTFIALAVPITANLYTPKLLKIFLRDKVNLVVLCALGAMAAHSVVTLLLSYEFLTGQVSFWISCAGVMIGWSAIIPYYFYVLGFLNPETIIARVTDTLVEEITLLPRLADPDRVVQRRLNQKIIDLGSIMLKAVERSDRDVAIEATRAMARAFRAYQTQKGSIDPRFFLVDQELFTGLSRAAIDLVREERTWVEQKCLSQLQLAYNAALSKMPDAVSTISDAVKELAHITAPVGDRAALDLLIRFLNSFIREAFRKKDVRAIFDVFYQYKSLIRRLMGTNSEQVREMAEYLKYYAQTAKQMGMPFVHELGAYEVAELCELACESGSPEVDALLQVLLRIDGVETSRGIVKARAILGSYFIARGLEREGETLARSMGAVPLALLEAAEREILETKSRIFWEVTDRQVNLDYVDDARKTHLASFFTGIRSRESAVGME